MGKVEKRVFDENDEAFCGYCSMQMLDSDGLPSRVKGGSVKAPVQIVSEPGAETVVFEACFLTADPLFYLAIRSEEQFFLFGQWWMDGPKCSEGNTICTLVPTKMQDCIKQQEKTPNPFSGKAICPMLRSSTTRLLSASFETEDKKFLTKLAKVTLTMPRQAWLEYKGYRVRAWKASKNMAAQEKDDDDEKKDEEKKD